MSWSVPELTPSASPKLQSLEKIALSVVNVGLYNGKIKSAEQAKGTVVVTSHRLIYIDSLNPILNSVQVSLGEIAHVEYIPRRFASSAKIKLTLTANQLVSKGSKAGRKGWICTICSFSNTLEADRCGVCGVAIQDDSVYIEPSQNDPGKNAGECQQCTFANHPSLSFCEMCNAPLRHESTPTCALGSEVKLSFRGGNSHAFYDALCKSRDESTAAGPLGEQNNSTEKNTLSRRNSAGTDFKASFGIRSLQAQSRKINNESQVKLEDACESSDTFKKNMSDILAIADRLSSSSLIYQLPLVVGVEPSKSEAVARQLADLLIGHDELLAQAGGMLTLHEAYSLYNRCRGLGLISPREFSEAINVCEPLDLPLRARTLESGLRIVESRGGLDQALQRLLHWIRSETQLKSWRESFGFSARDVSEKFGCSLQMASETLLLAEKRGSLCRDEHISGVHFFPNLFLPT